MKDIYINNGVEHPIDSNFSEILLLLIERKLNMMLGELFQLSDIQTGENINYKDHHKLVEIVLREIANGRIQSAHIDQEYARNVFKVYEHLTIGCEICFKDENRSEFE